MYSSHVTPPFNKQNIFINACICSMELLPYYIIIVIEYIPIYYVDYVFAQREHSNTM